MASSLRVKSVQNLEELRRFCSGNTQSLRPKKGFVNYSWRNHHQQQQLCQAPRVSATAAVVNHNYYSTDSCSNSRISTPGGGSSAFNHYSASSNSRSIFPNKKRMVGREEDGDDVSGKLDRWVKESVVEEIVTRIRGDHVFFLILNNLDEAPFLVHIYSDGEEASASTSKTRLVSEKAATESWPLIKGRWGGGSPTPSGIILVEEMSSEDAVSPDGENLGSSWMDNDSCSASTKVWGILIQGKGLSCPACYILKTSRARSVSGFCTHFCLVRVKCFFETVDIQLKKLWLV